MPSFDVVSKVDQHELTNAVDQANREVSTRFDFKGSDARFDRGEDEITLQADSDFQLKQMRDILYSRLASRKIPLKAIREGEVNESGKGARQALEVRQGVEGEITKQLVKEIKNSKLKVQAAIQGDSIRVSGKKRDDLQQVISMLREAEVEIPLQFENYRD